MTQTAVSEEVETCTCNLLSLQNRQRRIRKQNKIKIDVGKTQYPLLRSVATSELGWRVWTREQSKEEVNVYWLDTYLHDDFVRKLRPYQRVNHFPGSDHLGKKNLLTSAINKIRKTTPKQFDYFPLTFNFPSDLQQFQKISRQRPNSYYIVKPCSDSQGRGIYLTKQPDTSGRQEMVVQQYIQNPLLIENNKFDLRMYVLLRSVAPLKIYVYEQGLSRFATCQYEKPNCDNQKNMKMHLTNYAINKTSPNFVFNKSQLEDNVGHKRSLTAAFKMIEDMGCDMNVLRSQIDRIIVKTIIAVSNTMAKRYKQTRQAKQDHESVCFQILGFDILIKQDFTPLLLQVNHSPSFCTQTPLDMVIKKNLLLDSLNILNLNRQDKISYLKSRNQQSHINNNQILRGYSKNVVKEVEIEEPGAYRKIYPLEGSQNEENIKYYEQMLKASRQEKVLRLIPTKPIAPPMTKKTPFISLQKIQQPSIKSMREKAHKSPSFHQVLNSLKRTKLKQLKQAIQFQQLLPMSFDQTSLKQMEQYTPPPLQFKEEDIELIKKEQMVMYDRRVKRDREKEKKKYIAPMPLNNVSIKLDDKFTHKPKEINYNPQPVSMTQTQFKIHSMFNTTSQRKRNKEQGNKTAANTSREEKNNSTSNQQKFRMTERSNKSSHSYSLQLKQKIQKMQLARLRIQKMRRTDKAGFMIIKSHSPQK